MGEGSAQQGSISTRGRDHMYHIKDHVPYHSQPQKGPPGISKALCHIKEGGDLWGRQKVDPTSTWEHSVAPPGGWGEQ